MFESIEAFKGAYAGLTAGTHAILAALTDDALAQPVTGDHRTLGRIAWHVATSVGDTGRRMGIAVDGPGPEDPMPARAADILVAYDRATASFGAGVADAWTDDTLRETDDMFGERWSRGFSLFAMVLHEVHHRGQMTVLMRQAGLTVPGVAGPAREDWARWGMAPAP
jgi:uncharacterized damage-inducible protein DinB